VEVNASRKIKASRYRSVDGGLKNNSCHAISSSCRCEQIFQCGICFWKPEYKTGLHQFFWNHLLLYQSSVIWLLASSMPYMTEEWHEPNGSKKIDEAGLYSGFQKQMPH